MSDAGYDLYSIESDWIRPLQRRLFRTGIALEIPRGFYGRIAPRSGLALKNGIDVLAGVIDSGFRSEIGVILYNTNSDSNPNESIFIKSGQKIAQIIFEQCFSPILVETDLLSQSMRGNNGYGSSGF